MILDLLSVINGYLLKISMANSFSKTLLYRWLLQKQRSQQSGFTLTEVLVSMVIAGIIISGLLFLVVELLRVDRREIALEQVQRDMQRAMDYVSDDLREAVYVYPVLSSAGVIPGTTISEGIVDRIPELKTRIDSSRSVPVLAFWRINPISDLPDTCTGSADEVRNCELAKTRRVTYSLVVYYQQPRDTVTANYPWQGESVLRRFELEQYVPGSLTTTPGYRDPVDRALTNFEQWEPDGTVTSQVVRDSTQVLVDYVDSVSTDLATAVSCPNLIRDLNSPLTSETDAAAAQYDYLLSPINATNTTGMFTCVRNPESVDLASRSTQDVYLFLQGNAQAAGSSLQPASQVSRLPALSTQVKLGGVIDRDSE